MITVVVKKSRLSHSFKYWGGVLNKDKKYYTRRVTSQTNPLKKLDELKQQH